MKNAWLFLPCSLVLCLLLFVPLPASLKYVLAFVEVILVFAGLSWVLSAQPRRGRPRVNRSSVAVLSASHPIAKQETPEEHALTLPRTVRDISARMTPTQFEWFSAALVIGLGEGHTFLEHCGGRGDGGVDVKLRNKHTYIVAVQSKLYAAGHSVTPREVRDFAGSIPAHNANYGYFVTTSTFSKQARQELALRHQLIRSIDGTHIDYYLKTRAHEIALAWQELQRSMKR